MSEGVSEGTAMEARIDEQHAQPRVVVAQQQIGRPVVDNIDVEVVVTIHINDADSLSRARIAEHHERDRRAPFRSGIGEGAATLLRGRR